jgi:hypothetical protein
LPVIAVVCRQRAWRRRSNFWTSGINDISRANNQLLAEIEGIHRTMERLFQWMDAEPRRRLIVRLISYSLVLWSAFAVVYLVILTLAL